MASMCTGAANHQCAATVLPLRGMADRVWTQPRWISCPKHSAGRATALYAAARSLESHLGHQFWRGRPFGRAPGCNPVVGMFRPGSNPGLSTNSPLGHWRNWERSGHQIRRLRVRLLHGPPNSCRMHPVELTLRAAANRPQSLGGLGTRHREPIAFFLHDVL